MNDSSEGRSRRRAACLAHVNSVLLALRRFNRAASGETDPNRVLHCACRCLTEERSYESVWIGLLDDRGRLTAGFQSAPGEGVRELSKQPRMDGSGLCALTVRLSCEDRIYGSMSVAVPREVAGDPQERDLLLEAAADIAHALHEAEHARERAELQQSLDTALRRSEEKFRSLFDTAIDWVWETDARGVYTSVSDNVRAILGYSPEEIVGKTPFDFMSPEEAERVGAEFGRIAADAGRISGLEDTLLRPDGSAITFETNAVPLFDESGRLSGYFGTCRDVTEIRRAEQALEESESALSQAQEIAGIGSFAWDLRDDSLVYSRNMLAMAGLDPDAFSGNMAGAIMDLVHPEDRARVQSEIGRMLERGETWPMEFRVVMPDGTERIWESRSRLSVDETGKLVRCVGLHYDVTEQRRAQERIEGLAGLLDASPASITVHDFDGNFLYANERTLELHGYTREELERLNLSDIDDPDARGLIAERMRKVRDRGRASFEVWHLRKDGTPIPLQVEVKQARWGDRDVMFSIALDISERKKVEEELRFQSMLLDQIQDMITATDLEGRITYVNEAECRELGRSREELIGQPVAVFGEDPGQGATQREIIEATREKGQWRGDVVNFDSDGEPIYLICHTRLLRAENGEPIGMVGISTDISDRKRVERIQERQLEMGVHLASTSDLDEALGVCLAAAIETSDTDCGGVYLYDAEREAFKLRVHQGLSEGFLARIHAEGAFLPLTELCLRGLPVYASHNDLVDPADAARTREGLKAFAMIPVSSGGRVIAALNVASHEREEIHPVAKVALETIGGEIGTIITRIRVESSLRESEARLRALFDSTRDLIYLKDRDLRYTHVNRALEELFGRPAAEIIGRRDRDLFPAGEAREIEGIDREVLKGATQRGEYLRTVGGELRCFETFKEPVRGEEGEIIGVCGFSRDITERRRAEEERRRLAAAVEQAAETIMITDPSGVIQYVNPAFERTTGYRADEVRDRPVGILKSGRQDAGFYRRLWATISSGEAWSGRMVNRRKDGTLFTEECTISPVRGAGGEINHFVAVKSDVSKALELEDQLLQAQKMEAVGRLAGGIAHDLNNLLTPILGYGAMFVEDFGANDPRRDSAEAIYEAGEKAKVLVRQLLAFGRKQPLEVQPVDLNAVVRGFQKLLRRTLREDIRLRLSLAPSVATVRADVGQIEQVLMNLAVNAQDAMPRGGTLTLETVEVVLSRAFVDGDRPDAAGPLVKLVVRDSGVGMDPETQERIFEPFFTTKEKGKGTGLGLATVYGIVRQHGGSIHVSSEPGRGSVFTIYLPADAERREADPVGAESVDAAGRGETVLVAEDDEVVRRLTCSMLRKLGYRVISERTALDCLARAETHAGRIDLLLSDVVMPDMNGRELYERIRAVCPAVRVVYMSGYPDEVIADRGVLIEGVRFIQKPFSQEQLAGKVREALDQPPGSSSA